MSLLPDPDVLLAVADRISRHATALRRHAQVLAGSVGHTTWRGDAARAFAHEALAVCTALRRTADGLDAAAGALRQHAAQVRAVLGALARAANDAVHLEGTALDVAGSTLDAAGSTLTAAGHTAGHVLDVVGLG